MCTGNQQPQNPMLVEIQQQLQNGTGLWQPRLGNESIRLVLPSESRITIFQEAVNILSRCVPPSRPEGTETGLVVGYVQSGKTMSFTTVAALARDNGYRMIIVIAGTSRNLRDQSRRRLIRDLRVSSMSEFRPWRHVPDPTLVLNSHHVIRDILDEWEDATVPLEERRTILVTVMKEHRNLQHLIDVLLRVDLESVPTLIIDDEGDQASLNTQIRRGLQSTTYRQLLTLKGIIPHHSFLQYTATPQAPLLINIVDILSPAFAEVITPGQNYVGGREFFGDAANVVRTIPQNEIPSQHNPVNAPPPSLLRAMRFFFLGAAVHLVTRSMPAHRSMMIHPSQRILRHGQYLDWAVRAREGWMVILGQSEDNPDNHDLLQQFGEDYADLQVTAELIPPFDQVVPRLLHAMRRTRVRPLNSTGEGSVPINWGENPYWILAGGQSMDRGFTVQGLTVSYMPRGPGVRNADTIQQRGRFFGYKRSYYGYCRVFLEEEVCDAFREYIDHEEDIRSQLIEHRSTGRPMSEWRRQFFLNRNLRPTRNSIIDINYQRRRFGNQWVYPNGPHDTEEAIETNRAVFQSFQGQLQFVRHDGLDRRRSPKNLVSRNIPLARVHEDLLTRINIRRLEDSQLFSALLRVIQIHLMRNPDDTCSIFLMGGGRTIRRGYEDDEIKELFQGRQYDSNGITYPGDRKVLENVGISVQLRYLTLGEHNQRPIAQNVPHAAVWIPALIARDVVEQPQGG